MAPICAGRARGASHYLVLRECAGPCLELGCVSGGGGSGWGGGRNRGGPGSPRSFRLVPVGQGGLLPRTATRRGVGL